MGYLFSVGGKTYQIYLGGNGFKLVLYSFSWQEDNRLRWVLQSVLYNIMLHCVCL